MAAPGRLRRFEGGSGSVGSYHLAQIPPADLHIPVLGQPAPAQLPLSDALEAGPLEIVGFDAPLGGGPIGREPLEYAPRHPDHAAVLADLDPELHGLPLGIPAGDLGEGEEHGDGDRDLAPSWKRRQKKLASSQNTPISEISLETALGVNG
jgi:hypothetical protein